MILDKFEETRRSSQLVDEVMRELGLHGQDQPKDSSLDRDEGKKSPSEIAVERFRQEYEKRVKAAAAD